MTSLTSTGIPQYGRPQIFPTKALRRVPFNMHCDALQVYLLLGGEDGTPRALHQMEHTEGDRWSLNVRLRPGSYRFRYYAEHATVTTYVRPDEAVEELIQMDGFDAVLNVPARCPYGMAASIDLGCGHIIYGYERGAV